MNVRLRYVAGDGWYAETQREKGMAWIYRSVAQRTIDEAMQHLAKLVGKNLFLELKLEEN